MILEDGKTMTCEFYVYDFERPTKGGGDVLKPLSTDQKMVFEMS
jgi:hypothetical protein